MAIQLKRPFQRRRHVVYTRIDLRRVRWIEPITTDGWWWPWLLLR